jgi:GTP-binding protein YchF
MKLGVIGFPAIGKTTIFNLLTGKDYPVGTFEGGGRIQVETAVAALPDSRLEALSDLLEPAKLTYATATLADINGMQTKTGDMGLPRALVNELATMDAFLHVVRAFEDPNVPHIADSVDPIRDIRELETEFLLNDLFVVERRLEKLEEEWNKGARERSEIERDQRLFTRLHQHLSEEVPLRMTALAAEEEPLLAGFELLTRKPILILLNISEGEPDLQIESVLQGAECLSLQGKLEMEIGQLPEEEALDFMAEYGITEPARNRIMRACCEMMEVLSFFTYNEKELRAWLLKKGSTALDAADAIHSDIARGFIRAEVIAWEDLIESGNLSNAKTAGRLRIEGKNYVVGDGELIYIRFNV